MDVYLDFTVTFLFLAICELLLREAQLECSRFRLDTLNVSVIMGFTVELAYQLRCLPKLHLRTNISGTSLTSLCVCRGAGDVSL